MTQRERQLLNWIKENPLISQQELADKAGITRSSVAVHISNLMKKGYITGKGYIVHTAPYVTVVGGVNMDIGGWPGEVPVMQDSNPGVVRMSLGGVGRNIAHNMALLGMDVRLLTVFGDDINAQKIAASCGELGIDISQSPIIPEGRTSTYLFITDEKGDMALAVSDMEIYKHLTPQLLAQRQTLLNASQAVVLDTNIPAESIEWLADHCAAPLFADPVSTAKAVKLKPVLGKLHTLKPNRIEAELLSGVKITDDASLRKAAETLLDTGLHRVFISLGSDGVFAADRSGQQVQLPPLPGAMVNTTGCGDAFMAAITWAYLQGTDLTDTAKAGLAASVIAMAGTRVLMSPVSTMMIHNPLTVAMGDSDEMRRAIQMLDEVKESIINAYEIKTGLSRTRLSHLMDAETWMNANKALELGFCDEIMFRREEAEADAEDSFLYSSRAVTNCLLNKLKAHAPKPEPRVKASDLEKRLALLKY